MKFCKSLSVVIEETLPDWRDKFLSYKDLKKQLKLIYPKDGGKPLRKRPRLEERGDGEGQVTKEVIDFVRVLEDEMEKFNSFIVEKEEDSVIKWKELQERVAKTKDSNEELMKIGREIVDFHGEMVLLENYSSLNYTGLVKILKKYGKRSGDLVRLPFVQKIMQQPFFTTHVLNQLVKECEVMLDRLFSRSVPLVAPEASNDISECDAKNTTEGKEGAPQVPKELADIEHMENMYFRQTQSALRVLKEIRSGSSTVNMFSLPPMQSTAMEEDWKKAAVLEQVAE